jgi:hypothetical protein
MCDKTTPQDDAAMPPESVGSVGADASDILARLRDWRSVHLARLHEVMSEAADEIERLRLRPCPYVTGKTTQYCTLTPFTLTDKEREAVEFCAELLSTGGGCEWADTLRGLLDRAR